MSLRFHDAMSEPTVEERAELDEAYARWLATREGDSNDDEFEAANELIELLMQIASITYVEEEEKEDG